MQDSLKDVVFYFGLRVEPLFPFHPFLKWLAMYKNLIKSSRQYVYIYVHDQVLYRQYTDPFIWKLKHNYKCIENKSTKLW